MIDCAKIGERSAPRGGLWEGRRRGKKPRLPPLPSSRRPPRALFLPLFYLPPPLGSLERYKYEYCLDPEVRILKHLVALESSEKVIAFQNIKPHGSRSWTLKFANFIGFCMARLNASFAYSHACFVKNKKSK